jgi:hypothetical protein
MAKLSPTTKDIALLRQLHKEGQLTLAPQFQRNAVWPPAAKAYLIDTILNERPIPLLFFQRTTSAQSGRASYRVIDGQQRLRAIFEFLDGRFRLTQTNRSKLKNKRYPELPPTAKDQILQYDLPVQELSGYTDNDIRDMFVRMNKYVVKLTPQEIRHAKQQGKFAKFVEKLGELPFWRDNRVFTPKQIARFRAVEFCAEVAILLQEGPQDKKDAIDVYYQTYAAKVPFQADVSNRLRQYLDWVGNALPAIAQTRYRKATDLYSLLGAINENWDAVRKIPNKCGKRLLDFESEIVPEATGDAGRYFAAASRQTDNLKPRQTRIEVIATVLKGD